MKMKFWLILATSFSTSLLAQQATTAALALPPVDSQAAAITNAPATPPAAKSAKKKTAKKKAAAKPAAKKPAAPVVEFKTVPLVPGPAVVSAQHVNLRGKAGLNGEVLSHLAKGDAVTVVEEIRLKHSGPDEPSAWAKVLLPPNLHVWVNAQFVDAATKTVTTKKLNLRGGAGENYSVLGTLLKGDVVAEVANKNGWLQIEAPTNTFAFMAAQYLTQDTGALAAIAPAAPAAPTPAPAIPATVTEPAAPVISTPATPTPMPTTTPTNLLAAALDTNTMPWAATSHLAPAPAAPFLEENLPPRIVDHEGFVRGTGSIQAPTKYELISPDNHEVINYLYTSSTNLDLSRYKGLHIIVTGQEGLDERWKQTPVITIQKIRVIE